MTAFQSKRCAVVLLDTGIRPNQVIALGKGYMNKLVYEQTIMHAMQMNMMETRKNILCHFSIFEHIIMSGMTLSGRFKVIFSDSHVVFI